MKTRLVYCVPALLVCLGLGCGTDSQPNDHDGGSDAAPGSADAATSDGAPAGFTELVSAPFTVPPGMEIYRCARLTVTEDIYVSEFMALAPEGTHHTVVTLQDPNGADGDFDCGPGTLSDEMIYASGVGTDQLAFPSGVAMKIAAGQQILLNLHLFNVSENPITARAGTLIRTIPAADVEQEAEMLFAGNVQFSIPSGGESVVNGTCTFNEPATVMTVWPHMHQYGTHMKVAISRSGGGEDVIHDRPYSFYEQINWPLTPAVTINSGDRVRVTCTYMNTSGSSIGFGDSSEDEMCFAGLYRYPKAGTALPFCIF